MRRAAVAAALFLAVSLAPAATARAAVFTFGGPPGGPGAVGQPASMAIRASSLYITAGAGIKEFTLDGEFVRQFGSYGKGDGQFEIVRGVALLPSGDIVATDQLAKRIETFDATGTYKSQWPTAGEPWSVAVDPQNGDIFVAESNQTVERFSSTGTLLKTWGSLGSGDGQFGTYGPTGIAVDGSHRVYVVDYSRADIQVFDPEGTFLSKMGGAQHVNQGSITIAPSGNVLASSSDGIVELTSAGDYVTTWYPESIAGYSSLGNYFGYGVAATAQRIFTGGNGVVFRFDSDVPYAALEGSTKLMQTTDTLELDASHSSPPVASTADYRWDLDGDGTFERDTGNVPTTTATYATAGKRTVRVKVISGAASDVASVPIDVRLASPPGPIGASINDGDQFTNDPQVRLNLRWPKFAQTVTVSNDGGFGDSKTVPVGTPLPWTLRSSGPERLPKTVYVRFDDSTQTFQDDIILDETAPTVQSAEIAEETAARAMLVAAAKRHVLKLKATDNVSGVARMQITQNRKHPGRWRPFKRRTVLATGTAVWVRVRDAAKNPSRWRRAQ